MTLAAFDLGTTAVKGVVVTEDKVPVFQHSLPVRTIFEGDSKEQDPRDWYAAFCGISQKIFESGFRPADISGIIMSGQMQDLIPIDRRGRPVRNAILYSDARAVEEAAALNAAIGKDRIRAITGNGLDSSIPAAKILWFKKHEPQLFAETVKFLVSSKDFVIQKICGESVADITAASTAGIMDIRAKKWDASIIDALEIRAGLLPALFSCGDRAGAVTADGEKETGFLRGTPVYAGSGDAGASTLASGVAESGEYNIYLGTSGWLASVSGGVLSRPGVFNLAAIPENLYINVVPFLNAGNVHKWVSGILRPQDAAQSQFDYTDFLLKESVPGSRGLLFLPYLSGERFPVMDGKIRGAYIGISNETSRADMARACLEGVAFSIRQGLEAISKDKPRKVSLVGGGAKTLVWRQSIADILGAPLTVPEQSSEYLPAIALCAPVFCREKTGYGAFVASIPGANAATVYSPDAAASALLEAQYRRFCGIYPNIRGLFG